MKKLLTVLFCVILVTGLMLTSCRREPEPEPEPEPVPEVVEPEPEPEPPVEPEPEPVPEPEPEPPVEPEIVPPEPEVVDITREKTVDPDRPAERTGGDFYIALNKEPEVLDPHMITNHSEQKLAKALFEGLLSYDPQTGLAVPGLAESWEMTDDGLVYTFYLREAQWSDGEPITAQTVVDSWMRAMAPETGSPYAWFFGIIEGAEAYIAGEGDAEDVQIEAVDDHTFEMTLSASLPSVVEGLPLFAFSVVPVHAIDAYGDNWTDIDNLVVNGPFEITAWADAQFIALEPNASYWDAENVFLDAVVYFPVPNIGEAVEMFTYEDVDWVSGIPKSREAELEGRDDFHKVPYVAAELSMLLSDAAEKEGEARMAALKEAESLFEALEEGTTPDYYLYYRSLIDTSTWGGWFPNMMGAHPPKDVFLK